jgi:uncharacterized protein GlcG (DUF336 family)
MSLRKLAVAAGAAALAVSSAVFAQAPQYGPNITLDQAKRVMAGADAEARKNNWVVAIAILDTAGNLVYYQKADNTQTASVQVAIDKGVSAAIYRRPTKVFQDLYTKGGEGARVIGLRGASVVEGGVPIVSGGRIIGGIGVSGAAAHEDGQIARAGAGAL